MLTFTQEQSFRLKRPRGSSILWIWNVYRSPLLCFCCEDEVKKERKKSVCDIWQMLDIALSLDKKIDFYLVRKEIPQVRGIYVPVKPGPKQGEGMGFKMQLLWVCSDNPLKGESERSILLNQGAQRKPLLAALSSACSVGHPRTLLTSFLWLLCLLNLEELLFHKIWSPDCPGPDLRFPPNACTK